ncbi:MAG TPA: hypothetical protein VGL89_05635 [Candidatus Koribacter sp.]
MSTAIAPALRQAFEEAAPSLRITCEELANWLREHYYQGYEPDDLRCAASLQGSLFKLPWAAGLIGYFSEHSGVRTRKALKVPHSYTPTTLALCLAACAELYPFDPSVLPTIAVLRGELLRLRHPNEPEFCWGDQYDERFERNLDAPVFKPDTFVSYLAGSAMMTLAERVHDESAITVAESVGRYFITRLNRSVDEAEELCFSTSPDDHERVYHKSALVASYLARLWKWNKNDEYLELAQRAMKFLRNAQLATGMWYYGLGKNQKGINAVQTSYNAIALRDYRHYSGDRNFEDTLFNANEAFKRVFFETDGKPKMFVHRLYPVDIRACSQAMEHFAVMMNEDVDTPDRAVGILHWTLKNMRNPDNSFAYRKYATGHQRMAYVAWGQAHTFHAMARMRTALAQ